MSNTNLVLGANWDIDEWPDYVSVSHEAAIAHGEFALRRKYVPERTCTVNEGSGYDSLLEETFWHLSCGHMAIDHVRPNYCPNCGAKVEE